MNQLMNQTDKTPIEVFLVVDADGKTSARKVYKFLELADGQFTRWAKTNITENGFAIENEDYIRVDIDVETPTGGIVKREDYKLTAGFAKKLCMTSHTERGEEARNYFIEVEKKLQELAIQNRPKTMNAKESILANMQATILLNNEIDNVKEGMNSIKTELKELKEDVPLYAPEADEIVKSVNRVAVPLLGGKQSNAYRNKSLRTKLYKDIYRDLYHHCNVNNYKAIKRRYLEAAKKKITDYDIPIVLSEEITQVNNQLTAEL